MAVFVTVRAMRYRVPNGKKINWARHNSGDATRDQVKDMAERLDVPFSDAAPDKHRAAQDGENVPEANEDSPSP